MGPKIQAVPNVIIIKQPRLSDIILSKVISDSFRGLVLRMRKKSNLEMFR